MYCTTCGNSVPTDANFCSHCGAKQSLNKKTLRELTEELLLPEYAATLKELVKPEYYAALGLPPQHPETLCLLLPGDVPLELVLVKAGSFMMGSPNNEEGREDREIQYQVTLTRDYYMGKYPITQAQWEAVMGENPSHFKGANRPVENVSWDDIQVFLQKANGLLKAQGKLGLPTEAQWEYAARGGDKSKGYVYAGGNELDKVAWYRENSGMETHTVGEKHPNELGLYDMSGNVWEWCTDWFGEYAAVATTDPVGSSSGRYRVLRGGDWSDSPRNCRAACRSSSDPSGLILCSFRVVFFPV